MAKNQFKRDVRVIRSDNALEFDDSRCKDYFAKLGIVHQTSCVDRPQQNGRVERKHRNVLEMARALRFQAGLPLKFWGDCVLTATYLINRIPTVVNGSVSPYEKLFKIKPDYGHLRTFGCLAMAYNPNLNHDKFAARGGPLHLSWIPCKPKGLQVV